MVHGSASVLCSMCVWIHSLLYINHINYILCIFSSKPPAWLSKICTAQRKKNRDWDKAFLNFDSKGSTGNDHINQIAFSFKLTPWIDQIYFLTNNHSPWLTAFFHILGKFIMYANFLLGNFCCCAQHSQTLNYDIWL